MPLSNPRKTVFANRQKKSNFPLLLGTFEFEIMNLNIGEDKTFLAVFAHMPRTTIFAHFAAANRFS